MIITYMAMPTDRGVSGKRRATEPIQHQKQADDDECCIMMPVCKKRHSAGVHDARASSFPPSSMMQPRQGASTTPPPIATSSHLQRYGRYMRFVMVLARQRRTEGICCIPCDYVHRLASMCDLPVFKLAQFRYNSINWASHYYTVHRYSLTTTSVFIDLFDRYMSNLVGAENGRAVVHDIFTNSSNMIILPIVLTRIAMGINEDKTYRLTSVDVNRFLSSSDARQLTKMDFVNQERTVLMTLNFKLYDFSSLLTVREALISKLPLLCGCRSPHEEPLFSSYCRYVVDVTQVCYAVCSRYAPLDVAAVCIYIAYVWWPKNYVRIIQCASQQHQHQLPCVSSTLSPHQHEPVVPQRVKKESSSIHHLCTLVDCSLARLNDMARDVLDQVWSEEQPRSCVSTETLSCIVSYVAQKYKDDDAGCVSMIGYPTQAEFDMYKSTPHTSAQGSVLTSAAASL